MKIALLIFKYFPCGGLQKDFLRIAEAAARRGHELHVYTSSWTGTTVPDFLTLHLLSGHALSNHGKALEFFRKTEAEKLPEQYDVVAGFNCGPGLDVFFCGDVCAKTRMEKIHGKFYRMFGRFRTYCNLERAVFAPESRTLILDVVDSQRKQFIEAYQTPEYRFRRLCASLNGGLSAEAAAGKRKEKRIELGLSPDDRMVLTVSRDLMKKGADRSILALAALPENLQKKTYLYLLGEAYASDLKQLALQNGVIGQVFFEGMRSDVADYLLAADLLLHPARKDLAGNILPEALMAGLPVLCTDNCGLAACIMESHAGCLLSGNFDQTELDIALHSMLWNTGRLWKLRENALAFIHRNHTRGRAENAVDILEEVAHARHS